MGIRIEEICKRLRKFKDYLVNHPATAELKRDLNERFKFSFSVLMNLFIFVAIMNIFILILSPTSDYDKIIDIGERGSLFLVAITGLTFTYASALGTTKNKDLIKSGEYLLKSFLIFVIGMVFSISLRKPLMNPSNTLGLPEIYDLVSLIITVLLMTISLIIIIVSGYFFVKGFTILLESLLPE